MVAPCRSTSRRTRSGALLEVYVPRYGPEWEHDFLDRGAMYARIEADRMFTFQMDPATLS